MKVFKYKYNPNKKGVFRVSIVKNPAVGEGDLVLMAEQEIKGIFYAPVMIPDLQIERIDDSTGEKYLVYYDAETVEQLAHNYFKQCGNSSTNVEHEFENTEGVYPVESWIVKDSENDLSKALGMPKQKVGTWIMGYKCESAEVLEKIKNQLLQGLSIEGYLDTEVDTENPIAKFNSHKNMLDKLKEGLANLLTLMSAAEPDEKELKEGDEGYVKPVEQAADVPPSDAPAEPTDTEKELATALATIVEMQKKIDDLEAEKAKGENDATLMSTQLFEVKKAFDSYKSVKMSSQKLGDEPAEKKSLTPAETKHAKFLENVRKKI